MLGCDGVFGLIHVAEIGNFGGIFYHGSQEHYLINHTESIGTINWPMKKRSTPKGIALLSCLLFMTCAGAFAQPTFINKIPLPPLLDAATDTIKLEMSVFQTHKFNPGDPSDTILNGTANQVGIETWAYNMMGDSTMTILAPTLKWHTGQQTNMQVSNMLPQMTTTHWHGAEVPAYLDGGPHQMIDMGVTWNVNFLTLDSASTMWYHPHIHDNTFPQVGLGLSGMIICEQASDPIRATLPRTYGVDDWPVIVSDLALKLNTGNNTYSVDTTKGKRPYNIVNGVSNPYIELPAHMVRLRLLNGSTRKGMLMGFSDSYTGTNLIPFTLIASDGGYAIKPDTLLTHLTGPGERMEVVLDLSGYSVGDMLYLRNLKEYMPGSVVGSANATTGPGAGRDTTIGNAFLQIRIIADPSGYTPVTSFTPFTTQWDPGLEDTLNVTKHRTKRLINMPAGGFTIDSLTYIMDFINDTVCVGAKEIWTIKNESSVAHPFHIHKIFFRILDIDSAGTSIDLASRGLNAPKDDVLVMPGWTLRFMGKFDDYPSMIDTMYTYMYHCHILTHEDHEGGGMMHQFVVTDAGACATGVADGLSRDPMRIYPNPAHSELFLQGRSAKSSEIQVLDLQGRLLRAQRVPAFDGQVTVDVAGLAQGLYLVRWQSAAGSFTRKVVIE